MRATAAGVRRLRRRLGGHALPSDHPGWENVPERERDGAVRRDRILAHRTAQASLRGTGGPNESERGR
jgi:hypothetical protein